MSSVFESFANNSIIESIGWTLVHFLWQASVVAMLVYVVSLFLRRSTSNIRYGLFVVGMLVMLACPVVTLTLLLQTDSKSEVKSIQTLADNKPSSVGVRSNLEPFEISILPKTDVSPLFDVDSTAVTTTPISIVKDQVESLMPVLVGGWMVGVAIQLFFMTIGIAQIFRWRKRASVISDANILQTFESLVARMQIANVALKSTAELSVSAVVGFWRPLVLMPVAMLTGLSAKEMELVLAHELAHVRRYDYVVNMIQKLATSVFFFHPAIWWVSKRIANERENCCDDIAAAICGDRVTLAKALANMEAIRCEQLALAANGGTLTSRIRRLLEKDYIPARSPLPVGGLTLLILLIVTTVLPVSGNEAEAVSNGLMDSIHSLAIEVQNKPAIEDNQTTKKEVVKVDSVTGIEQRVFDNIRLFSNADGQTKSAAVDLKYSNVIPYTFIPQRVAKALGARKLGEIDFAVHDDVDINKVTWKWIPNDFANPTGYLYNGQNHTFVDFVKEYRKEQLIVPYLNDPLPAEKHLGFYGLNKTKQTRFDVVRIDEVDLGIGKKFGGVNALVLNDDNSEFGLLGSKWGAKVRGDDGETLWHLAIGEFRLLPPPRQKDRKSKANVSKDSDQHDLGDLKKVLMKVEVDNGVLKHLALRSIDVGRSPTELLQHFSMLIERRGSPDHVQSITNMESIVSAHSASRSGNNVEATEFSFSLPEGSDATASISGDSVKITPTDKGMRLAVENGQVQWIDSVGVVRAIAKAVNSNLLVINTRIENNEVNMSISASGPETNVKTRVRVTTNLNSGAPDDEEQPPHGSIRYEIFDQDANGDKPMRLKMKWRYDVGRLAKEAEVESGKSWEKIIWGDDFKNNEEKETGNSKADKQPVGQGNENANSASTESKKPWHVKGKVVKASGEPMAGVPVYAHCGIGSLFRTGEGKTDARGNFEFRFGPGIFSSNKKLVQAATISIQVDGFVDKNLHRQGDLVAALEMPDEIGWGKTKEQLFLPGKTIELEFVLVESVSVSGYVFDKNGKPQPGFKISLRGDNIPPSQSGAAFGSTGDDGKYVLSNVPAGYEFQVLVKPPKRGHPWLAWASAPLTFANGESEATHINYSENEREFDFACKNLNLILEGDGENWKSALSTAAKKPLKLDWRRRDNEQKVRTDVASLVLRHD